MQLQLYIAIVTCILRPILFNIYGEVGHGEVG